MELKNCVEILLFRINKINTQICLLSITFFFKFTNHKINKIQQQKFQACFFAYTWNAYWR